MKYLETNAVLSACERYRYALRRVWDHDRPTAVFLMCNPSTASADEDDATVRKCVGFADRFGCGTLVVVNLFAFRARRPKDLFAADDPVGPDNNDMLAVWTSARVTGGPVVAAWGAIPAACPRPLVRDRPRDVLRLLAGFRLRCLAVTQDGHPGHPLMLGYDRPLLPYPPPATRGTP